MSLRSDATHERDVATLLSEIDRVRRRLYALLRSADARVVSKRTASGKWSIIENVRHLIFAEQAHLGTFLPDGFAWSPVNLPRDGKTFTIKGGIVVLRLHERQLVPRYVGTEPTDELEGVLGAWNLIHQPIRKALKAKADDDVQYALERHLGHLLRHVEVIEKQLARARKGS